MERDTPLDVLQLRIFARVADLRGVSAAARSLKMPKSSISRALARLEEDLGAALVERSTRHLRLTDAGHLLYRHATRILDDLAEARNAVGGLIGHASGTLRVSVGFTFAVGVLGPMLPGFLQRYPDVRLVLAVDNRRVDLLAEEIDVAVRIGPLEVTDLIARRLGLIGQWLCGSPSYLEQQGTPTTIEDLAGHKMLAHAETTVIKRVRTPAGTIAEIEEVPGTVVPEPAVAKAMLIGGAGLGWLPDFEARNAVAAGSLVRVLADHDAEKFEVHAVYPGRRSMSAKVRVFIDALVAHMASDR